MKTPFTGEWTFSNVHDYCAKLKQSGEINSFHVSHDNDRGRLIHVESDDGWNPEPLYEEFPDEAYDLIPN